MIRRLLPFLLACLVAFPLVADGGSSPAADAGAERTADDPRLFAPGKLTVATGEPVFLYWFSGNRTVGASEIES